jgi:hypothetical protein
MPDAKTIEIPEIKLARLTVTIEGQTPLIVHRFGERARKQIEDKQQGAARTAKPPREPRAEFLDALYVIGERCEHDCGDHADEHVYGFPTAGIKKALVSAGGRFADETMTILRGVINVQGDLLQIRGSAPRMRSDTVRIDGGKTSSIAYRPEFWPWQIDVPVVFNATLLTEAKVLNLFQLAGFSIGIGDWRPEKNGTFGQFSIKGATS